MLPEWFTDGRIKSLDDKISDWFKIKAFSDNKINVAKMTISLIDTVKNFFGKRKQSCLLPPLSPSPTMFFKIPFL